jgi:RNA polymerase sigma factor (sigma-70 family)
MTDAPDDELLEQFARDNSGLAFAALVERHIALVHSVALRHTADPQHAQDITQAAFIILARKAPLNRKTVLPGWLYHTARLTAANFQRAETSRIRREQEAYMQSTLQESAPDTLWSEMSPLLDDAMARLGVRDRDALVLRYFQNKSLSEVGAAMGLEERTAQKRVLRAIEKCGNFSRNAA